MTTPVRPAPAPIVGHVDILRAAWDRGISTVSVEDGRDSRGYSVTLTLRDRVLSASADSLDEARELVLAMVVRS